MKININLTGPTMLINIIQIVFIILKVTKQVDWNWLVVLSPLFVEIVIFIIILVIMFKWIKRKDIE